MDQRSSRTEKKEKTALRVLLAARDEFEEKGFEAASIRQIAARAGVSVGSVMHHYGDKRQLLYAALYEALEEGLASSTHATEGTLLTRLVRFAAGMFAVYEARPTLSRTLLKEGLFAEGPWGARFVEQTARAHAVVRRLAEEGRGHEELPPNVDAEALGLAFLSFFNFALIAWVQGVPLPRGPLGLLERLLRSHLHIPPPTTQLGTPTSPPAERATAKVRTKKRAR
jgi:AcrR family transcriptional regulator